MYVEDNDVSCVVDGSRGIYAPQSFVRAYGDVIRSRGPMDLTDDIAIVAAGPDHEHYDEAWGELLDNARIVLGSELAQENTVGFSVVQDGDIFLVRDGVEWCDECDTWLTTDTGCEHAQ